VFGLALIGCVGCSGESGAAEFVIKLLQGMVIGINAVEP
jgi:hypothetical protein